jgi:hypothetical protein
VRLNGKWLSDLKYLFEHDPDTLAKPGNDSDTINK